MTEEGRRSGLQIPAGTSLDLPPNYSQITPKKVQQVKDLKVYYIHKPWEPEEKDYVYYYTLYSYRQAEGNLLSYIYTKEQKKITSPWLSIAPLTENDMFHEGTQNPKILPPDNHKLILATAKEHDVETAEFSETEGGRRVKERDLTPSEIWRNVLQKHLSGKSFLYKLIKPLTAQEIQLIKSWNFERLEHDYFYEGLVKDERIIYFNRAQLIHFHSNPYEKEDTARKIQKYNSHGTLITPTKGSKTHTAKKIGKHHDEATKSGLKGFSDAKESHIGALDREYKPVFCDNVHEFPLESLRGLLEIREFGESTVTKGKAPVHIRTTAAIIFILNPPDVRNSRELAQFFIEHVRRQALISSGAVASRDGLVMILLEIQEAVVDEEGGKMSDKDVTKNRLMMEHILEIVNKEVETRIFPDGTVQNWLDKRIARGLLLEPIKGFIDQSVLPTPEIKVYWSNIPSAFRHIRGYALKEAIMDNLKPIYIGEHDVTTILRDAEEHLRRICHILIESLQNLLNVIGTTPIEDWILNEYKETPTMQAKVLVLSAAKHASEVQTVQKNSWVHFSDLASYYDNLEERLKVKGSSGRTYSHFSVVEANMPKRLTKFNQKLRHFGISISKMGEHSDLILTYVVKPDNLRTLMRKLMEEQQAQQSA